MTKKGIIIGKGCYFLLMSVLKIFLIILKIFLLMSVLKIFYLTRFLSWFLSWKQE